MTTNKRNSSTSSMKPKFEVLIIFVLFMCFIMWSISRCGDKREAYQEEQAIINGEEIVEDLAEIKEQLTPDNTAETVTTTTVVTTAPVTPASEPEITKSFGTTLYITIDGWNMRDYPHLDSVVTAKLPLFEPVIFMNEVTEFKQEINLGKEMANEPWVKIQTNKGKTGWVYGAGVHYHKKRRAGVE